MFKRFDFGVDLVVCEDVKERVCLLWRERWRGVLRHCIGLGGMGIDCSIRIFSIVRYHMCIIQKTNHKCK